MKEWISTVISAIGSLFCVVSFIYTFLKDKKTKIGKETEQSETDKTVNKERIALMQKNLRFIRFSLIILFVICIVDLCNNLFYNKPVPCPPCPPPPSVNQDSLLILAGGGSVRNFLLEEDDVNVKELKNTISLAIASGSSWTLLNEDYHSGKNDKILNKYNIVCLSAGKIPDDFYYEYLKDMKNNSIVVEVLIGYDKLVTYVSNDLCDKWGMKDAESILLDTLDYKLLSIISDNKNTDNNIGIFTTNKTSGTLDYYKKGFQYIKNSQDKKNIKRAFENLASKISLDTTIKRKIADSIRACDSINLEKMIEDASACVFYENIEDRIIVQKNGCNRDFIILGSQYYKPKYLNKGIYKPLVVLTKNQRKILKPMYLYFLASKKTTENSSNYYIDPSILNFLKEIEKGMSKSKKEIKEDLWNDLKKEGRIYYLPSNDGSSQNCRIDKVTINFVEEKTIGFD